jgi:hypothetical protein
MPRNVKFHNLFDSRNVKVLGADAVTAGIPVLYLVAHGGGPVSLDVDITITEKSRVVDAWVILQGTGTSSDTITIKNSSTAITNAMNINVADTTVVGVGTISDASYDISAAGTLRVTYTSGGGASPPCEVYVLCHVVA